MLHIVNKSPFEKDSLAVCLDYAQDGSDVLLIEDGVYACVVDTQWSPRLRAAQARLRIAALSPDLHARGIYAAQCLPGVALLEYAGFVDLVEANAQIQSWL